ncbi:HAD-IA family hydrolase [Mycobacterium sp. NPDC003449]
MSRNAFHVEAVLTDIDGTLVDSTPAVERTWRVWAAHRNLDAEEILRVCHGRRTEDTVAQFLAPAEVAEGVAELDALELADMAGVVALPGTQRLLGSLPVNRWAAVTSGSQMLMRARLAAAGLPVPDVLIAAEDVTEGKPSPQGYLRAAAALGFAAAECLVIEDAPAGLAAGRAASAHTLAVGTSHDLAELTGYDAAVPDLGRITVETTAAGSLTIVCADSGVRR